MLAAALLFFAAGAGAVRAAAVTITTPAELTAFMQSVSDGQTYEGQTVTLGADIDMAGTAWEPAGTVTAWDGRGNLEGNVFQGTFDGNNHAIRNLDSAQLAGPDSHVDGLALFGALGAKGEIRDLTVTGTLTGTNTVAGIAGISLGSIAHCSFSGTLHSDEKDGIVFSGPGTSASGGIAGISFGSVTDCSTGAGTTLYRGGMTVGGIAGQNSGTITGCTNRAALTGAETQYPSSWQGQGPLGGIAGSSIPVTDDAGAVLHSAAITGCTNEGSVDGRQVLGGIAGYVANSAVANCLNTGRVTGTANNVGGITGSLNQQGDTQAALTACTNRGAVTGATQTGGIVGYAMGATLKLDLADCLNRGAVTGKNFAGGIAGKNEASLQRCFNLGDVTATGNGDTRNMAGGVAGASPGSIRDSANTGTVRYTQTETLDEASLGGVAGSCAGSGSISRSYSLGRVLVDADVKFADHSLMVGGVVGSADPAAITGTYYAADFAGDAMGLNGFITSGRNGLQAVDMLGAGAKTNLSGLFADGGATIWKTDDTGTTPPYLATAGCDADRMDVRTAALADTAVHTIALPSAEGVTVTPAADQTGLSVITGGDFRFTVAIAEGYRDAGMVVSAGGTALTADANGWYTIPDIKTDLAVTVTGVIRDTGLENITFQVHGENYGWSQGWITTNQQDADGRTLGTTGRSLQLEAVQITDDDANLKLTYRVHVQNLGWSDVVGENTIAGTTGRHLRIEAIQIWAGGSSADKYKIQYRVHMRDKGWGAWTDQGEVAGTTGEGRRMEALQIRVVAK